MWEFLFTLCENLNLKLLISGLRILQFMLERTEFCDDLRAGRLGQPAGWNLSRLLKCGASSMSGLKKHCGARFSSLSKRVVKNEARG